MNTQIDIAIKRARGYWFVDGFTEIGIGGLLIILAAFLLVSMSVSQASFPSWFLSVTGEITIVKIVSFLILILILWWLKDHFTYPRTGLLIVYLLITSTGDVLSSMPVWFPIGLGLVWALLIVLAGEWMGLRRFRVLGGMILVAGIGIGIWQLAMGLPNIPANIQPEVLQPPVLESINRALTSLGLILLISGAILVFSGILTFIRYRRENPEPYAEDV